MPILLILDPSPTGVHKALSGLDAVLAFAPSVFQLWPVLQRLQPDILICDVSANDASGRAIAEKCRDLSPGTRLLFSGPPICRLQTVRLIDQGLVAGFLPKPWQIGAVHDVIRGLLPHAAAKAKATGNHALKQAERRDAPAAGRREAEGGGEGGGRYRLDEAIGEGGSGRVYRAHDLLLDMPVAVKLLHPVLYHDARALSELQSEARICMSLAHPHIVRLYNLEKRGGHYFLVMEYIDGPSLGMILRGNPHPSPAFFEAMVGAIAAALGHAHAAGVVHSDLTPANILVGSAGVPKLIDFGIAALANQRAAPGELVAGTPSYMSPEQLRGEALGPATDIFAFGVVAYQMLSGYLPQAENATLADLAHTPRPPLSGVSAATAAVLARALAFNPGDRWPTARAFADALLATLEKESEGFGETFTRVQQKI